jgi:hypothetical protein
LVFFFAKYEFLSKPTIYGGLIIEFWVFKKTKEDMKNLKSGVLSLLWLAVYVYATQGYLIAMGKKLPVRSVWLQVLVLLNFLISIYVMAAPYELFGQSPTDGFHTLLVTAHVIYMLVGVGLHLFSVLEEGQPKHV